LEKICKGTTLPNLLTNSKDKKQQPKEEFRVYKKWDPFNCLGTYPKEEKPSTTLLSNSKIKTATKLTTKKRLQLNMRFNFISQMHVISVKSSSLLFQILQYSQHACTSKNCRQATSVLSKKHLSTSSNQNMMVHIVDAYTENLQFGLFCTLVYNEWERGTFTVM
jgi:hypothetical protein